MSSPLDGMSVPDMLTFIRDQIPIVAKGNQTFKEHYLRAVDEYDSGVNVIELPLFLGLKRYPADIEEFMFSGDFLARPRNEIYPAVIEELIKINNPDGYRLTNPYTEVVFTGGIGPLSADTEFLTPTGWVRMDAYKEGMQVGEYNSQTGKAEFRVPEHYQVRSCTEFLHFKTKYGIDQALSSEHRVLFRQPKSGRLEVRTAQEIATCHARSVKGFSGKFLTTFQVDGRDPDESLLRVQVMVCADATIRTLSTGQCYLNLKKHRKIERARELLIAAGIKYVEFKKNSAGYVRFGFKAPVAIKLLSSFAWGLSSESLRVLVEESLHWDGNKNTFCTTLKEEADFMSYAGSAAGYRTVMEYDSRSLSPTWLVRFNSNTEVTMQGVPKTPIRRIPSEDGFMYCFATKTGFFIARRNGRVFITGNSAKTTSALYTLAYQLYLLSCFRDPHSTFGMDSTSEILLIFQSMSGSLAHAVDYIRFREICEQSAYFRTVFPFNARLRKYLKFPGRIEVKSIGTDTGSIGQNVIGGIIDELNFMAITHQSKKSIDRGTYNQARTIYDGLSRRRKSRFMDSGRMPGILCLVSSKRYPGEFTDQKIEEAKTDPTIYIYDKRVWDIKPAGTFNSGWFSVFVGDLTRKAHILAPDEQTDAEDAHMVVSVPLEYKTDFEDDIIGALRDIAGVGTLARYPFLLNVAKVNECFGKVENIFTLNETDFVSTKLHLRLGHVKDLHLPRWAHIDLGVTNDSCGMAIGHVPGFKVATRVNGGHKETEVMPVIRFDGMLRVRPPKGDEILFYKIRDILYILRDRGMNIQWVTFDSFQSVDSIQLLKQKGFIAGRQSMDVTNTPYDLTKAAFYDGRIEAPAHEHCLTEFLSLEKDNKTGKIDHPPNGSKDVSDASAGVVHGLTMRREIWAMFNIPIQTFIDRMQRVEEVGNGSHNQDQGS